MGWGWVWPLLAAAAGLLFVVEGMTQLIRPQKTRALIVSTVTSCETTRIAGTEFSAFLLGFQTILGTRHGLVMIGRDNPFAPGEVMTLAAVDLSRRAVHCATGLGLCIAGQALLSLALFLALV